jgi:dTDP-glucose pyrophosphorylase
MAKGALETAQVLTSGTLRDVISALDRSALGVALVVDDAQHLLGIFTDGDVRRALLHDATLEAPLERYMRRAFTSVSSGTTRAEVLELMSAMQFAVVPILDERGVLRGLHRLHDLLGVAPRPNWAVIMAGGRGTRLGALTREVPKPMMRVAGRPILERLVLHLVGFGIRRIFLSVNYLAHVIEEHFGDGSKFDCTIEYLREERALGTGGALSLLAARPTDPLLVLNGDLVTQANVGAMIDIHTRARPEVMLTMATRRYFHTIPYGVVEADDTRVVRVIEKPSLSRLINAGIYLLSPRLLERIPRDQDFAMTTLVDGCLERGELVESFELADDWIDVGEQDQLKQARGE